MSRKVSRKDKHVEELKLQVEESSESAGQKEDDFGEEDCESDFEDQANANRVLKRRKRDEERIREERKIIGTAYLPSNSKKLSACVFCRLVLNKDKWRKLENCPNCPQSRGQHDTTDTFSNLIGSVYPRVSWVAQWQGMKQLIPGFYAMAIKVSDD